MTLTTKLFSNCAKIKSTGRILNLDILVDASLMGKIYLADQYVSALLVKPEN